MKTMMWIFFALLVVSVANAQDNGAGVYGYGYWAPKLISEYLNSVDANSPAVGPASCQNVYSNALIKGVIDIRYALGYFDDSTGEEKTWSGVNYGLSPSLDIEIFKALRQELTAKCRTKTMRACGFQESGDPNQGKLVLQKNINLQGKNVLVRLTLTQASATYSFAQNKGPQAARQKFLTAQSEDNFFGGVASGADVVFYNGHSRNGGGPDFNPPILNSSLHVNYKGYYEVQQPGLKHLMSSLKADPNKGMILALFSCYSRLHFYKTFMQANPKQRVILSAETIDYFDSLKASVGYLEGVLRGSCGQALADTAKQEEKLKSGFQGYNIN